ncbi:V-type ATP synthase subunit A [Streptomyces sp. NBRC 110611]|uniref:V-type ATP synthase subunit D n=1 Tax=Streptomyces sp. NBRC 110611 TaxID=1621259 RepID=UPI000858F0CC|nr:V-type ATP synthase subunit D [Streptomyces sp. NBRC 110611]GAU69807.1 V-type ATP synthase subunit A [Streptomyces sp. NBRC 110611]
MTSAARIPPSRAGRLRLRRSLAVALRGADVLEQKLRILRMRHQLLLEAERACADRWHEQVKVAEAWLLSGLLLGGEQALAAAVAGVGTAEIALDEATTMGVRYPSEALCVIPDRAPTSAAPRNTALVHAEAAYREAVRAAAEYAAARAAARIVGTELLRVRQRVRALRRHSIPRLEQALARIDLALEQGEHEDAVRRRWAARRVGERGTL